MGQFERQLVYFENGSVYKYAIHYLLLRAKSLFEKWSLEMGIARFGWRVKGRLNFFHKFIRFGGSNMSRTVEMLMNAEHSNASTLRAINWTGIIVC